MLCFCKTMMKKIELNHIPMLRCPNCGYLKKCCVPTAAEEKRRYDYHVVDEAYQSYMERVYQKIKPYLLEGISLDFGCGKAHTLCDILAKDNRPCRYYDLYYYPEYPKELYSNIILIEVLEHIADIYALLKNLRNELCPKGRILIMTQSIPEDLAGWWYLRDITHISFVNEKTMAMLASLLEFQLIVDKRSSLFILERIN